MIYIIRKKLKEEKGASMTILNFSFLIFIFLFIIIMINIISVFSLIIQSRNLIEKATVQTVQNNYANVYHTSRESYSGGYLPNSVDFNESVIERELNVNSSLLENMGLKNMGDSFVRIGNNNEKLYKIKDIKLKIRNEEIKSGTKNFIATTEYTLLFPMKILEYKKDLEIKLKVKAKYTNKF